MKKLFQNKSLLKSIQIFLVCLVVLGGGLGIRNEANAACSITGSYSLATWSGPHSTYSYSRVNENVSIKYYGGRSYNITDSDVTVLYREPNESNIDCDTNICGFLTLLKENLTGDYYFLISEDDFMPDGCTDSSGIICSDSDVCQAFKNDFIPIISANLIGGTIDPLTISRVGGLYGYSIITAKNGVNKKIHFIFADFMGQGLATSFLETKGWSYVDMAAVVPGSFTSAIDICGIFPSPSCTLTADPTSIDPEESSTLTWTTENTDSADINGAVVNGADLPNGSKSVSPDLATTYTLTVTNTAGDTGTCSATVGVKVPPDTTGGLVPCGRLMDDCGTDWDERADCNLCHFIIMSKLIIDFLIKIAVVVGALFIALGGILYILAAGDTGKMALAKGTISRCLLGFAIIFTGWLIVNTIMVVFGYADLLDSGGKWHKITCNVPMRDCVSVPVPPPAVKICGDENVDKPNSAGFFEECDTDGSSCGSLVCLGDCTCKTDPTPGVCGVWFSGILAGSPSDCKVWQTPFNLTDISITTGLLMSDWVANGNYSNNTIAFHNATATSFDGIAIDKNTRLELWEGPNYTGNKVLDETGPMIINNFVYESLFDASHHVANCFGLTTAVPPWTNCISSDFNGNGILDAGENMNDWASIADPTKNGSCKITCTAP